MCSICCFHPPTRKRGKRRAVGCGARCRPWPVLRLAQARERRGICSRHSGRCCCRSPRCACSQCCRETQAQRRRKPDRAARHDEMRQQPLPARSVFMSTVKMYRMLRAAVVSIAALGVTLAGSPAFAEADHQGAGKSAPVVSVGPQYDTTHVYVSNQDIDAFVDSFVATFGGKASPRAVFTVTPTPSKTASQYVQTPVGMLSVFAFQTPVPYPFANERTGYLVTDIDK